MKAKYAAIGCGIALLLPSLVHLGVWLVCDGLNPARGNPHAADDAVNLFLVAPIKIWYCDPEQFARMFFPVSYLVGISAVILGSALRVPGVGPGLLFGGLLTLWDGFAYSHWIDARLIFMAMLGIFVLLIGLGIWQWSSSNPAPADSGPPAGP